MVLDLRKAGGFTDYFVICTGANPPPDHRHRRRRAREPEARLRRARGASPRASIASVGTAGLFRFRRAHVQPRVPGVLWPRAAVGRRRARGPASVSHAGVRSLVPESYRVLPTRARRGAGGGTAQACAACGDILDSPLEGPGLHRLLERGVAVAVAGQIFFFFYFILAYDWHAARNRPRPQVPRGRHSLARPLAIVLRAAGRAAPRRSLLGPGSAVRVARLARGFNQAPTRSALGPPMRPWAVAARATAAQSSSARPAGGATSRPVQPLALPRPAPPAALRGAIVVVCGRRPHHGRHAGGVRQELKAMGAREVRGLVAARAPSASSA